MLTPFFRLLIAIVYFGSCGVQTIAAKESSRPLVVSIYVAKEKNEAEWYGELVRHSNAAASALGMDVEQVFAGTERPKALRTLRDRLSQAPKPDYVIFANQRSLGDEMLKICDEFGVNAFLYVASLEPEEYVELGRPREKIKHWIGELIPDDEKAGYDQAQMLIKKARSRHINSNEKIKLLGITGLRSTTSAIKRQRGLSLALAEHNDVQLVQLVAARWLASVAQQKYELLVGRHGLVDAVWVANDPMALGVLAASEKETVPPLVGGVDWVSSAIDAIKDDRLCVTIGGHFIDIAYTMALLRNHYDGIDFAEIAGTASLSSQLISLSSENINSYADFFDLLHLGKVDYKAALSGLNQREALVDISMQRFKSRSSMKAKEY